MTSPVYFCLSGRKMKNILNIRNTRKTRKTRNPSAEELVRCRGNLLEVCDFEPSGGGDGAGGEGDGKSHDGLRAKLGSHSEPPERAIVIEAFNGCGGNRADTARMPDISRSSMYHRLKKYGLKCRGTVL
jgi:transcriptional regulator of acetoin/glycerol metabolism